MRRRDLLRGLAALGASALAPAALAQSAPQFASLSKSLTGFAYDDPALAASMLRAMTAAFGGATLAKIAAVASAAPDRMGDALRDAGLWNDAQRVIVALYSGAVDTPKGPVVFAYNDALGWRAVPWTKPNAVCGGVTDYWATAPSER
jgi:hypothetical protein